MQLDEYFAKGREMLQTQGALTPDFLAKIVREHGGLCHSLARKYAKNLDRGEALSYFFESLPQAIAEYDPLRGKAGTALTLVFCRIMSKRATWNKYVGSVRVPVRNKEFAEVRIDCMEYDQIEDIIREAIND